jgi:hypothetical protein
MKALIFELAIAVFPFAGARASRLGLLPVRFRTLVRVLTETSLRSLPTALARR